jgi:hypothetical protein
MCRKLTIAKMSLFLAELAQSGVVAYAAKAADVGRTAIYNRRVDDPEFARKWDEAIDVAVGELEMEARRRALDGVEEPVYQGGREVGSIRKYSDTLLIFILKAAKPQTYRDNLKIEHAGKITTRSEDDLEEFLNGLNDEQLDALERIVEIPTPGGDSTQAG